MIFPDRWRRSAARLLGSISTVGVLLAVAATPAAAAVGSAPDATATFNGKVWTVAYSGDRVYVGGEFTAALVNGKQVPRTRLAAIDARTGALLPWAPAADGRVKAIATSGGSVYVAGDFDYIDGIKRDSLARLDASTGAVHSTFKHTILGKPYALAAANGRLYLGGAITSVNGQVRTRLAAFDLYTGALDTGWAPSASDQVESLAATGSRVYVGGKFHKINDVSGTARIAALHPTTGAPDLTFKAKATVIAYALTVTPGGIVAAHGGQGGRVISYDSTGVTRWTATFDGDPQAVALLGGTVYVGGHFDAVCRSGRTGDQGTCLDGAVPRVKLAAFALADGKLESWTANGNGVAGVLTLAVNPSLGSLAAGGAFTTINGVIHKRFAQFR